MRRFVSVALALVMSLCVSVPAFAADSPITAGPRRRDRHAAHPADYQSFESNQHR